jgi:hypothetical protein
MEGTCHKSRHQFGRQKKIIIEGKSMSRLTLKVIFPSTQHELASVHLFLSVVSTFYTAIHFHSREDLVGVPFVDEVVKLG